MKAHFAVYSPQTEEHNTLEEFVSDAQDKRVDGWTATRNFAPGDLAFFYFGEPIKSIVGIGFVASLPWDEEGEFYWTEKRRVTFCNFKPVRLLDNPVLLEQAVQSSERLISIRLRFSLDRSLWDALGSPGTSGMGSRLSAAGHSVGRRTINRIGIIGQEIREA